jgi:hypothetical protein
MLSGAVRRIAGGTARRAAAKRGIRMFCRAVPVTAAACAMAGLLLAPGSQAAASRDVRLTGTRLASALLPVSYFPSGCQVVKSGDHNSGSRLEHGPARYRLVTFGCPEFLLSGLPQAGLGETATAGIAVSSRRPAAGYQQTAWQFSSSSRAAAFCQQMYAFTARCATITAKTGTFTAGLTTRSLKKTRLGGRQAFQAVQAVTAAGFPATINDTLVTVAGTDVFLIDAAGRKPPARPAPATALLHLIIRVQASR